MTKRSAEELNREFYLYFRRWSEGKDYGGLDDSVAISEDGVVSCRYHLPYEAVFSEDEGKYYFTASVRFTRKGLKEAVSEQHEKVEEHLALLDAIRKNSPSGRKISNSTYFSGRNIIENGDYVKVRVRIKKIPKNLNVLFENVRACVIQPTFRGVDKVRSKRF